MKRQPNFLQCEHLIALDGILRLVLDIVFGLFFYEGREGGGVRNEWQGIRSASKNDRSMSGFSENRVFNETMGSILISAFAKREESSENKPKT